MRRRFRAPALPAQSWGEASEGGRSPPPRIMARKEGLIGRKVGMTQVFADDGSQIPVTVIQAGPCTIVGVRTRDSHGYDALQLGFEAKKKVTKPMAGHFKKDGVDGMRMRSAERRVGKDGKARSSQHRQTHNA